MRRIFFTLAMLLLAAAFAAPGARAVALYSNSPDLGLTQNGSCLYNTTCGPANVGAGSSTFAAQLFTLAQASTVTGAGFNAIVFDSIFATAANWMILDNDGAGGLPGTLLASGNAGVSNSVGPVGANFPTTDYSFAIPAEALAAGDYYLAIQAVTTNQNDHISFGVAGSGAAQTFDGGTIWGALFRDHPSVAVSLTGEFTVPEPTSLALFGLGLTAMAAARRRVRR